jgi:hypothetical protein
MMKESIEVSNESIHNLYRLDVFEHVTQSNPNTYISTEGINTDDLLGKTVESQPSILRKIIHEVTESIALLLIIFMRWFDLMRADADDIAVERIRNWFWEWLDREHSIDRQS